MKEVTSISVMVHPHYSAYHCPPRELGVKDIAAFEPRKMTRKIAGRKDIAVEGASRLELLHRFYRREVNRVAKTPSAILVIFTGRFSDRDLEIGQMAAAGMSREAAQRVYKLGFAYQDILVEYARRKLGKRFVAVEMKPHEVLSAGEWLREQLKHRQATLSKRADVHVFGELREMCVEATHRSLSEAGFASQVVSHKSIGA